MAIALAGCAATEPPAEQFAPGGGKADGSCPTIHAPMVIGVRNGTQAAHVFDDRFIVYTNDGTLELAGSTHPWESSSTASPDIDGDGIGDVGWLRPGTYQIIPRPSTQNILGLPTYHVTVHGNDRVPGWRDTDHDGTISDDERAASEARGDTLGAILFHAEGPGGPQAIGCQVSAPSTQQQLVQRLGAHPFTYVLVDADYFMQCMVTLQPS